MQHILQIVLKWLNIQQFKFQSQSEPAVAHTSSDRQVSVCLSVPLGARYSSVQLSNIGIRI